MVRSSLLNFTLIGATCRPSGAKKPKNRSVSTNNTGRAALWAATAGNKPNDWRNKCVLNVF